jgi:hypothetical protein
MRFAWLLLLVACNGDENAMTATTSFQVTNAAGAGTSPLDPLQGQTLDIEIVWPEVNHFRGTTDPQGCKTVAVGFLPSQRTASGASKELVQREILDRLLDWDVKLQLCDQGFGTSTVALEAVINELNLSFGCFGVPETAMVRDGDGYPLVTSFTATQCSSTILDVVNNRVFSNPSFSITFETGPTHLP